MKKVLFAFFALFAAFLLSVRSSAADRKISVTEYLTGERGETEEYDYGIEEFYDKIPPELSNGESLKNFSISGIIKLILSGIKSGADKYFFPAGVLLALSVVIFLVRTFSSGDTGASKSARSVLNMALCVAAASCGVISFEAVASYLKTISDVAVAATTPCIALLIASGRSAGAAAAGTYLTAFSALCEKIYSSFALPLIASSAALTFAESTMSESGVKMSSLFRKASTFIVVATATVSSFVFSLHGVVAAGEDTLGMKTVKFAVGAAVPLVGGAVSDTLSTVAAGAAAAKNAFGVALIVILVSALLSPLLSLLASKIALALSGAVAGCLGRSEDSSLFGALSSIVNAMIALVASCTVSFMIIVISFISMGAAV